jgi:hypothetical protein
MYQVDSVSSHYKKLKKNIYFFRGLFKDAIHIGNVYDGVVDWIHLALGRE